MTKFKSGRCGVILAGMMVCVCGLASPVWAQAGAPPAAPAAAPQVDEQAKTILMESAAAIKAMTGVSYKAKRSLEGQAQFTMKTEGEVKFVRDSATPSASAMWIKGRLQFPMQDARDVYVAFANGQASWVDFRQNTVFDKKVVAADTAPEVKRVKDQLVPEFFVEREPFEKTLRSQDLTVTGVEEVNGEKCQVVRTWSAASQRGAKIFISMNDRLPRRFEPISGLKGAEGGQASFTLDIRDLKVEPDLKAADIQVDVPQGFSRRMEEPATKAAQPAQPQIPGPVKLPDAGDAPPQAQAPAQPKPMPGAGMKGGFAPGTVAPAWMLRTADDKEQTLASHAGKVVVLGFWGPLFGQSKAANLMLDEVNKALAGKNAAVYSVACRDPGKRATKLMADWGATLPLLVEGDQTAKDYQVQGYPSFAVIDGEGKIAAFFQGATSKDDLMKAVETAMGGK
ncbi:MAG: TlpA family protein disulfide reductase [Phycisphaerales bacterium]